MLNKCLLNYWIASVREDNLEDARENWLAEMEALSKHQITLGSSKNNKGKRNTSDSNL